MECEICGKPMPPTSDKWITLIIAGIFFHFCPEHAAEADKFFKERTGQFTASISADDKEVPG